MKKFCAEISDRSVGNAGNREATDFFRSIIEPLGYDIETQRFDAVDWEDGRAKLSVSNSTFRCYPSPYSLGFEGSVELVSVSNITELESKNITGKILLLHSEIAIEQLMPKNFVFYNPDHHKKIVSLLELKKPAAIISATGRNATLAGGVYPFPLIEDGDFDIPSVFMTEEEGKKLHTFLGEKVTLVSRSKRIAGSGENIIAKIGNPSGKRIIITAHIDAKKGTPGAIDNATGVTILLLLAKLLKNYDGDKQIEIVAFNGEDYYAVSGQMEYIKKSMQKTDDIVLNINIDGAGYKDGLSAFSFYDLPPEIRNKAIETLEKFDTIKEGVKWFQGDHSIFIQSGIPAVAVSSAWFSENVDSQEITHTPKDNLDIVSFERVTEIAEALSDFVNRF